MLIYKHSRCLLCIVSECIFLLYNGNNGLLGISLVGLAVVIVVDIVVVVVVVVVAVGVAVVVVVVLYVYSKLTRNISCNYANVMFKFNYVLY